MGVVSYFTCIIVNKNFLTLIVHILNDTFLEGILHSLFWKHCNGLVESRVVACDRSSWFSLVFLSDITHSLRAVRPKPLQTLEIVFG